MQSNGPDNQVLNSVEAAPPCRPEESAARRLYLESSITNRPILPFANRGSAELAMALTPWKQRMTSPPNRGRMRGCPRPILHDVVAPLAVGASAQEGN
jgi:hypothetical protein